MPTVQQEQLAELILAAAGKVLVLTGAGISTPSGIPDFRSPHTGLWSQVNPMEVAHISVWEDDPATFWKFYRQRLDIPSSFSPNPAHGALATMEDRGLLLGVATQNIDGLHQRAGSRDVVELHGSVRTCVCECGASFSRDEVQTMFADDGIPYCTACRNPESAPGTGRYLKPNVVLFGEMLPPGAYERAWAWAEQCELMICAGTSLEVRPVSDLPLLVLHDRKPVAVIARKTSLDDRASVRLTGDIAEELTGVLDALNRRQSSP